jgi:16S rRNA (guanine527-N7)-methyltransferase
MPPSDAELRRLLDTVVRNLSLPLSDVQIGQFVTHFSLLLRWNEKINLTAVRRPEEIATRHFEESLFLATILPPPQGLLVDVGSGAGFPGLPLHIAWPGVDTILLEPTQKKAVFLKEVVRTCRLPRIEVRTERLEQAACGELAARVALVTLRAVKPSEQLLADVKRLLAPGGRVALFLGEADAAAVSAQATFQWRRSLPVPQSERRVILIGENPPLSK